ncbi:hypothetical protein PsW64_05391 [Pseudovibrio sp. W64]|uniref:DUF805 domain-containing protein n=1 Tax=unclassified Pseudovibrio TaxID=2627060 RepID=UPI00070D90F7|nr:MULTISPECIES: DUF805 domain-containing protein [unclassified Pseudovibrio]KZK75485.1 hypothetical protein PsW64_05391 [Pseudovibrio sp. W64]KZK86018.1 hypothetical protein PsAD13_01149 [Pseudovibrio sp. Ad13]KZK93847.1 hypothetical protein PsAD46_01095 [Pseudovibrio sp. Ad46]KZL00061.1 hypothetical protein PsAD5_01105 [Pseudovibrio sp. Ad5]KZL01182.1 hypothetical protein PsW74_01977 [Pseudovibrio sp. W74]
MPEQNLRKTSLLWLFCNPFGRISKGVYWLATALIFCVLSIAVNVATSSLADTYIENGTSDLTLAQAYSDLLTTNPLLYPLLLIANFMVFMLVIKRLQDRGVTGFVALTLFLPFLNLLVPIIVGFLKSQEGPNKYGPASNTRPLQRKK